MQRCGGVSGVGSSGWGSFLGVLCTGDDLVDFGRGGFVGFWPGRWLYNRYAKKKSSGEVLEPCHIWNLYECLEKPRSCGH